MYQIYIGKYKVYTRYILWCWYIPGIYLVYADYMTTSAIYQVYAMQKLLWVCLIPVTYPLYLGIYLVYTNIFLVYAQGKWVCDWYQTYPSKFLHDIYLLYCQCGHIVCIYQVYTRYIPTSKYTRYIPCIYYVYIRFIPYLFQE